MSNKRDLRFFNTTDPCNPDDHYMLPPEERLVGAQLHRYISDKLATDAPAHLVIFDRRPNTKEKSWDERISWEHDGDINVLRC